MTYTQIDTKARNGTQRMKKNIHFNNKILINKYSCLFDLDKDIIFLLKISNQR